MRSVGCTVRHTREVTQYISPQYVFDYFAAAKSTVLVCSESCAHYYHHTVPSLSFRRLHKLSNPGVIALCLAHLLGLRSSGRRGPSHSSVILHDRYGSQIPRSSIIDIAAGERRLRLGVPVPQGSADR